MFEPGPDGVKVTNSGIALFFVSYVVIGGITLLNVVVAV
jgi:hypothetical protein